VITHLALHQKVVYSSGITRGHHDFDLFHRAYSEYMPSMKTSGNLVKRRFLRLIFVSLYFMHSRYSFDFPVLYIAWTLMLFASYKFTIRNHK